MFNESDAVGVPRYSAKRNLHQVVFRCDAPEAKKVSVVGDFNGWNPLATPMTRQPDGRWMVSLELSHGFHEYLLLVDGKPVLDPNATGKTRNARYEHVSLMAVS
jgi:1,4-alpha-glucan branching enzyme